MGERHWLEDVAKELGYGKPEQTFTPNGATPLNPKPTLTDPRTKAWAEGVLAEAVQRVATAAVGARNGTLNSEAWSLYHKLGQFYDDDALADALLGACHRCGVLDDDGEAQCRATIRSGFSASVKDHGGTWYQNVPKSETRVEFVLDLPVNGNGNGNAAPSDQSVVMDSYLSIFAAENGFWESRESLKHIYTAAMSRLCSPWAVLANVAARTLYTVRPNATLPELIGGPGSLNWFAAVAARSGGGKGSSSACGRDLIQEDVFVRNLGSGEGICQQFYKPGNINTPPVVHEAIMFEASEIGTMSALAARQGQTTMEILKGGFSGETLGFSYRNNDHHVEAHSYRMTLVLSLQPKMAGPLLDGEGGGMPQRFQWFPARDRRVSAQRPWWPGPLTIPGADEWRYPRELTIPKVVEDTIVNERVRSEQDDEDALNAHALFAREKFAFALALLDGRTQMNEEDWELSGIAAEVSERTRGWVIEAQETAVIEEAEHLGRRLGVQSASAETSKSAFAANRVFHMQKWVQMRLTKCGPQLQRELTLAAPSRNRQWLGPALQKMCEEPAVIGKDQENRWVLL